MPKVTVARSNEAGWNGSAMASAWAAGRPVFRTPSWSMPREKSAATTRSPGARRAASAATSMVPAQRSSSASPGRGASARSSRRRQAWSTRRVITRLSRS